MRKRIAIRVGPDVEKHLVRLSKQRGLPVAAVAVAALETALDAERLSVRDAAQAPVSTPDLTPEFAALRARIGELETLLEQRFAEADERQKSRLQRILQVVKNGD